MDEALGISCMATSFRAALLASLLRHPTAKLRQRESPLEGRRFATLIKLHLCRMRRFLLTDERIWSATAPHAVFSDGTHGTQFRTGDGVAGSTLRRPCLWVAPLRLDVPSGIARWVLEEAQGSTTARTANRPIYFEPSLSRPLGFTYALRGVPRSCITAARFAA